MGYYIRYFIENDRSTSLDELRAALQKRDCRYDVAENGDLTHDGDLLAEIDINVPGDSLFDGAVSEMIKVVEDLEQEYGDKARVLRCLRNATAIVAVRLLGDRDLAAAAWSWVEANRKGLLQFDDSGFCDEEGVILTV